ncbi:MAG: exodeoxyribonuclease III [Patescibacteria group bacterium]
MTIMTWNINGIRASIKKGLWDKIDIIKPDVFCFQETKADTLIMETADIQHLEYDLVFNSCKIKKGYSGVANFYSKDVNIIEHDKLLHEQQFDDEGRYCSTLIEYKNTKLAIVNCYYPQGGREYRIPFKLDFYKAILKKSLEFKSMGYKCILLGDFNTTFADIDLARPKENRQTTGCLPEEREVLNDFVKAGFVDVFREFYPDKEAVYSYWDQITRARERNVGWRIDFFLVDSELKDSIEDVEYLMDTMGSDHCPVIINLK